MSTVFYKNHIHPVTLRRRVEREILCPKRTSESHRNDEEEMFGTHKKTYQEALEEKSGVNFDHHISG